MTKIIIMIIIIMINLTYCYSIIIDDNNYKILDIPHECINPFFISSNSKDNDDSNDPQYHSYHNHKQQQKQKQQQHNQEFIQQYLLPNKQIIELKP